MTKEYVDGMRVNIPWGKAELPEGVKGLVYEVDEQDQPTGETILLPHDVYKAMMKASKRLMVRRRRRTQTDNENQV